MLQQVARGEARRSAARRAAAEPGGLGRDWVVLRDCRLWPTGDGASPTVLIHPARGVAVLDVLPSWTPDATEAVRARLGAVRFPAVFAGHLPVVHVQVSPRQVEFLPWLLDDAFAAEPPLRLPGGDAWVGAARVLATAEQPAPRAQPRRARGAARSGRRRRRPPLAALLRKAGAVLLCVSALSGVSALALREVAAPAPEPALEPPAAAAAPTAPAEDFAAREAAPPPAPRPAVAPPGPPSPRGGAEAAPVPEAPSLAPLPAPAAVSPAPLPRAAPPPSRTPPERTAAPRRRQEAAGAATPPEAAPQRCGRVGALVGSGAPLGDADMRFFNENCIRW